jgi:hypothetical protein
LVELGDAYKRFVGDALRLGPGAAGGLKLLDEVLGVAAEPSQPPAWTLES